ncbi:trafficking kinesin-binding protein 2 isoform X2 [Denticeps clupeoides]|uniref:Trafficking protein, kinesin binding 2 n=1 Tax=Denticeps clupeoides TaxID=299321 RepID=A0AAY4EX81_9TELE|nr:trafficking kinesin-binding protein 2 isoform X2 [Denticeps clupeoides]
MFEVKPMSLEKKETASGTDDDGGKGSSSSGSLYLYEGQDWVLSPACTPDEPTGISPLLAEETFRYMILSADRVEQMTKTYNDIEVVTHLLAERDRDLELAARIGQSLLQRNHMLQERNEAVEEQLAQALDRVHQLQHELGKKDELLRMVASASEESEMDSSCSTPLKIHSAGTGVTLGQLEVLQSKLQELEDENLSLRTEASHLKKETITYEEKEQQLVNDCVKELRESNSQMVTLTEELSQKNETLLRHQEEIAQLLSQIVELQHRVKELALEKEELRIHLQASKDAQRQLTAELNELSDRNAECVAMFHESQEEIKELRSKQTPAAGLRRHLPYGLLPMDSLAAEIEGTMRRELSVEEDMAFQEQRVSQKRVFQTVRSINETVVRAASLAPSLPPIPGSGRSTMVMTAQPFLSSAEQQSSQDSGTAADKNKAETRLGQPGSPGGNDLVSALHRLSLRRQNFLCERQFFQAEKDRKLQEQAEGDWNYGCSSPMASSMSSFTNLSELSASSSCFKTFLPEKLQIVKPMEGSLTLHHWQQLAKPHLATILDPHPGVVTKGFRSLPQDAIYRLTDLEEDEEEEEQRARGIRESQRQKEKQVGMEEKEIRQEEDEEEEEAGITFQVQCSSTPEEKERGREGVPPSVSPLTLSPQPSTTVIATTCTTLLTTMVTSDPPVLSNPGTSRELCVSQPFQILTTTAPSSVFNPGKCQSSTFSTYTFTTCRIMHPCDVTQVTQSSVSSPCVSGSNTPSSLRTGPSTPVTPCRLSLGNSFPPRHASAVPPHGLAKLLLERGISAQVSMEAIALPKKPAPIALRLRPSTPPNSPSHSPCPSPIPTESRVPGPSDNFLASRPAELFLQDVYGVKLGRASRPDLPSPDPPVTQDPQAKPEHLNVSLVERLRQLGFATVCTGANSDANPCQDSSTFLATGAGSLLDGLRRNQSVPAMIGGQRNSISSPSHPTPPRHPTSLALPNPPWGNLKPKSGPRRHASLSQATISHLQNH